MPGRLRTFCIFGSDGSPVGSLAPVFATYVDAATGDAVTPPTISETASGSAVYSFTPVAGAVGVIDAGDPAIGIILATTGGFAVVLATADPVTPATGLEPAWWFLEDDSGADVSPQPTFTELGGGLYRVDSIPAVHATGVIDLDTAEPRFVAYNSADIGELEVADGPLVPRVVTIAPPSAARGDIAIVWGDVDGDLSVSDDDLLADEGLVTAVLLSLFVDRRAEPDDVLPSGDADRRGWLGDEFAAVEGDRYGSRLWLLDRAKRTPGIAREAEGYVREAVAWMLEDKVSDRVEVTVTDKPQALLFDLQIFRPGADDPVAFKFAHVWRDHA